MSFAFLSNLPLPFLFFPFLSSPSFPFPCFYITYSFPSLFFPFPSFPSPILSAVDVSVCCRYCSGTDTLRFSTLINCYVAYSLAYRFPQFHENSS